MSDTQRRRSTSPGAPISLRNRQVANHRNAKSRRRRRKSRRATKRHGKL